MSIECNLLEYKYITEALSLNNPIDDLTNTRVLKKEIGTHLKLSFVQLKQ